MDFCHQWLEEDYNPFFLFNADGKINTLNTSAQFLLGETSMQTIFNLATSYAAASFGFKRTHIDVSYGKYKFFAIEVGYQNEEEIGIRLYRTPSQESNILSVRQDHKLVNIYTLLDLAISTHAINHTTKFVKILDPSLPDVRLNANLLIKYVTDIFALHEESKHVEVKLALKTGEYLKIEGKKFSIFTLTITLDSVTSDTKVGYFSDMAKKMGATFLREESSYLLDMVLYT